MCLETVLQYVFKNFKREFRINQIFKMLKYFDQMFSYQALTHLR